MTSYGSLSGEFSQLMKEAALEDDLGFPGSRTRRNTVDISAMDMNWPHKSFTPVQTDDYGFPLGNRYQTYQNLQETHRTKSARQQLRWSQLQLGSDCFNTSSESKIKKALRKGIPANLRPKAWFHLSGAYKLYKRSPFLYQELAKRSRPGRMFQLEISQIFVSNAVFGGLTIRDGLTSEDDNERRIGARQALSRLLIAFAKHLNLEALGNSINLVAATILLVTKDELWTFWILIALTQSHGHSLDFFTETGSSCCVDQDVLQALIMKKLPKLGKHFKELQISLPSITGIWSASLFVEQLPFESALRVIDSFLWEGRKVLIRVALALFKMHQGDLLAIGDPFELTGAIKDLPKEHLDGHLVMLTAFDGIGSLPGKTIDALREAARPRWTRLLSSTPVDQQMHDLLLLSPPPSNRTSSLNSSSSTRRMSMASINMVTVEIDEKASVPEFPMRGPLAGRSWSKASLMPLDEMYEE